MMVSRRTLQVSNEEAATHRHHFTYLQLSILEFGLAIRITRYENGSYALDLL